MTQQTKNIVRAVGYFIVSIVSGLAVYQTPPASMSELGDWVWSPALTGLLTALMSLGINKTTPGA